MMKCTKKKTDKNQLEVFLMKVAENADNALREYLQERGGEQTLYVTGVYAAQELSFGMTENVCSRLKILMCGKVTQKNLMTELHYSVFAIIQILFNVFKIYN